MFRLKTNFSREVVVAIVAVILVIIIILIMVFRSNNPVPSFDEIIEEVSSTIHEADLGGDNESVASTTEDEVKEDIKVEDKNTEVDEKDDKQKTQIAQSNKEDTNKNIESATLVSVDPTADSKEEVVGKCGFEIISHKPNEEINFPIDIEGNINRIDSTTECAWNINEGPSVLVKIGYEDSTCRANLSGCKDGYRFLELQESVVVDNDFATSTSFSISSFGDAPNIIPDGTNIKVIFYELPDYKKDSEVFELPLVLNRNPEPVSESCGFNVKSIAVDDIINFPVKITGTIDNTNTNCVWNMSSESAGIAELFFESGDEWKTLSTSTISVINTKNDQVPFETNLTFNNQGIGLPLGADLKIVFSEEVKENVSSIDKYEVIVVLGTITPPKN